MDVGNTLEIKIPRTYDEQIRILRERNLVIKDEVFAKKVLSKINYYRFSAYALSLKEKDQFYEATTFEHIYKLYEFDRKLRLLVSSRLEIIEISLRTKMSYHIAHKYGAIGHLDKLNFNNEEYFRDMQDQINQEIERSKELFVDHHKSRYEGVFPIWVAIEVTSFGLLSKIYSNLKSSDQQDVANLFSNNRTYIRNWFYTLSTLRNICAHFGRLYNRHLPIHLKLSNSDRKNIGHGNTIFSALLVISKIIGEKDLLNSFITDLSALVEEYDDVIELNRMGFPENWMEILDGVMV